MKVVKINIPQVALLAFLLLPSFAFAQAQQTVDGAQSFLSQLLMQGNVNVLANYQRVDVTYRVTVLNKSRFLKVWEASEESAEPVRESKYQIERPVNLLMVGKYPSGKKNVCKTTISEIKFSSGDSLRIVGPDFNRESQTQQLRYTRTVKDAIGDSPASIFWDRVTVLRDGNRIVASSDSPRFDRVALIYESGDPEMLDRIEYAMKFLQMSCDSSAHTGF